MYIFDSIYKYVCIINNKYMYIVLYNKYMIIYIYDINNIYIYNSIYDIILICNSIRNVVN